MKILLTEKQVTLIKRKRGELNYSTSDLAKQTDINRRTLTNILKGKQRKVQPKTFNKLNNWLIEEMYKEA